MPVNICSTPARSHDIVLRGLQKSFTTATGVSDVTGVSAEEERQRKERTINRNISPGGRAHVKVTLVEDVRLTYRIWDRHLLR